MAGALASRAFREYLEEDKDCEVVNTSRGYTVLIWDDRRETWYSSQIASTPEALRDILLDLKQMAQTLNFLTEHKLLDYGTLCERTDEVTARFHELSDKIKAAETRMAEVAALRQQIINYVKTRDYHP